MVFVDSGVAALESLCGQRFDVIVSDMKMPGMDGAELLARVRDQHPHVARVVLTGHAEEAAMLKARAMAHQYLSKPCEPGLLEGVLESV